MRLLHLSTGDDKGAFSGAYRVHSALKSSGNVSKMFVASKVTSDADVIELGRIGKMLRNISLVVWKLICMLFLNKNEREKYYFLNDFIGSPLRKLYRTFPKDSFDYVFVYYVSNFLNVKQISDIAKFYDAKVIIYPMDMEPFTGGCHYSWGCKLYETSCKNCLNVNSKFFRKIISNTFENKKEFVSKNNPMVFCGSGLIKRQVERSYLFGAVTNVTVLLGLDAQRYTPKYRNEIRSKYVFNDEIVIYFGAQSIHDPRKGFAYLLEALKLVANCLEMDEIEKIRLFTVGDSFDFSEKVPKINHTHVDYIKDEKIFSRLYSGMDLFVSPSIEDSGPMMINESILSGTPVVAYKTGVALNLVEDGVTGFVASDVTSESLGKAIIKFIRLDSEEKNRLRGNARKLGVRLTSIESHVSKVVSILEGMPIN